MKENFLPAEVLTSAKCSQVDFGKLVGLGKARVNQLIRSGLLTTADDGRAVLVIESLRNFYRYREICKHYDLSVAEYFSHYASERI